MLSDQNSVTRSVDRERFAAPLEPHLRLVYKEPVAAPENNDIVSAVENALACAGELDCSYIFVSANGSDVTLAGWVFTRMEIRRSAEIAAGVKGVHAIYNELSRML